MKVVCPEQLLSLLRCETQKHMDISIDDGESARLIQRVSELMAAETLEEFNSYSSADLKLITPPPNPRFRMQIQSKLNLIFSPQVEASIIENQPITWSSVRSINLIGLER